MRKTVVLDACVLYSAPLRDFLMSVIEEFPVKATQAFINQVDHLKNPPFTADELLEKFRKANLNNTANLLENLL